MQTNMRINIKTLLLCLVIIGATVTVSLPTHEDKTDTTTPRILASYITSSSRASVLNNACKGYTRADLSSKDTSISSHVSTVNSSIDLDGSEIIRLAASSNYDAAKKIVQDYPDKYAAFVLTFAVGLIFLLIGFPFQLCCCCCPGSCPPRCCGRKSEYQKFSSRDLCMPFTFLITMLIFAIAACVYGLIATANSRTSYKESGCASAIFVDDVLNGNSTNSGSSYFMGVSSIPNSLTLLKGNLNNIDGNLSQIYSSSASSLMNQAITKSRLAETDTIKISNNDAAGNLLTLNYNTPIDASVSTGTISSTFPTVLGSYSSKTGLVWNLYTPIYQLEQNLTKFQANCSDFHVNLTAYDSALSNAVANSTTLKTNVESSITQSYTFIQKWSDASDRYQKTIIAYYIALIGLAAFCAIAAICTYNSTGNCCRRLMYLNCFFLFIFTLFGFLLSTLYSIALPIYSWSCLYIDQAVTSQYYLQKNFNFAFSVKTLQQIGVCMPYGDGNLIEQFTGTDGYSKIDTFDSIFVTLQDFSATPYLNSIYSNLTVTLSTSLSYGLGQLMDITDTSSINVLSVLANYSKGSYTNCNSNLPADSWVPSNSQSPSSSTIISCTATNGQSGTATTCSSGVSSTSSGCSGCMDSSEVFFRYLNVANSLPTDLSLRYGSICSFNTILNNVWTNYYKIKQTALGPTVGGTSSSTGVYPRTKTVETDINDLNTTVTPALANLFKSITTSMASISSLTDPTYGVISGLNCSLLGEDALRVRGTACGSAFTQTYLVRIIVGVISYLLFLAICCISNFGSKHYRQNSGEENNESPQAYESQNRIKYIQPQPQSQPQNPLYLVNSPSAPPTRPPQNIPQKSPSSSYMAYI